MEIYAIITMSYQKYQKNASPPNCIHHHTEYYTFKMTVLASEEGPQLHLSKNLYPEFSINGG